MSADNPGNEKYSKGDIAQLLVSEVTQNFGKLEGHVVSFFFIERA